MDNQALLQITSVGTQLPVKMGGGQAAKVVVTNQSFIVKIDPYSTKEES